MKRILLAIETGIGGGSLSLFDGSNELGVWVGSTGMARAEDVLLQTDRLLEEAAIAPSDLGSIAVSAGPGSFTGIRIGLATAMGLRRALDISLYSVSILRVMALQSLSPRIVVAVPLGRGALCVQEFYFANGELKETAGPRSIPQEDLALQAGPADECEIVVHPSLIGSVDGRSTRVVPLQEGLATLIARYCWGKDPETEPPLFVSKT